PLAPRRHAARAREALPARPHAAPARGAATSRPPAAPAREAVTSRAPATPAREAVTSRAPAAPAREAATSRPHAAPAREAVTSRAPAALARRHVSAAIRREVWARGAGWCADTDHRGQRCPETGSLELHHREAHALGGPDTVDNLELRCPPHNLLAAEQDFGRSHMDRKRGKAPPSLAAREGSDRSGGGARSDPATWPPLGSDGIRAQSTPVDDTHQPPDRLFVEAATEVAGRGRVGDPRAKLRVPRGIGAFTQRGPRFLGALGSRLSALGSRLSALGSHTARRSSALRR